MPTVTVAVPEDLKKRMDAHETTNWSAVARKSFEERLRALEILEEFAKDSRLTEADAVELGRELKKGTFEKYYAPRLRRERPLRRDHKGRKDESAPRR